MIRPIDIVCDSLKELSDISYQEKVWVKEIGDEISSFEESISSLFEDTGLGTALDNKKKIFSKEIDQALLELKEAVQKVNQSLPPNELVSSEAMNTVRSQAKSTLKLIQESLAS